LHFLSENNFSFTSQDAENRRTVKMESERLRYARAAALNAEIFAQSNCNVPCVMKNVKSQTLKHKFDLRNAYLHLKHIVACILRIETMLGDNVLIIRGVEHLACLSVGQGFTQTLVRVIVFIDGAILRILR
jgi:hypothetical protein